MQFMLIFRESPSEFAKRQQPEHTEAYWGGWSAYVKAIAESGAVVNGDGLQGPEVATTVRLRDGKRSVQDGPYADAKEQLGGYFVIDVKDLDVALEWAAKAPCASNGSVEVRPVLPKPPAAS